MQQDGSKSNDKRYKGVFMKDLQQTIERNGQEQLHLHEWFPCGNASHCVLVYPTWAGITDFERAIAERLNASGFEAVIVDFFGSTQDLSTVESRCDAMLGYTQDFDSMAIHLNTLNLGVRSQLQQHPESTSSTTSVLGFCLGGMCALISGQTQQGFANAISFHGLLSFPKETAPVEPSTRFMILNGQSDPMVPETDIRTTQQYFEAHRQEMTLISFSRTLHSFTIPDADNPGNGVQYKPEIAARSWRYALDLLQHTI